MVAKEGVGYLLPAVFHERYVLIVSREVRSGQGLRHGWSEGIICHLLNNLHSIYPQIVDICCRL
jgi:hypothetical protein